SPSVHHPALHSFPTRRSSDLWLELTTSEPSFIATRVSPPGTMRVLSRPVSTNGRRSTWRGATPASTQVGQVESASVGCAMKFLGDRKSTRLNSSHSQISYAVF